jgi:5-methylcytosine-specific restriction enzyme A
MIRGATPDETPASEPLRGLSPHAPAVDDSLMTRSRKQAWLRDELVLALDLYRRHGRNPSRPEVDELSRLLRAMPIEQHLADDPKFRNPAAVYLKVSNFVAIDPSADTQGMSRGGRGDRAVWDAFAEDPQGLAAAAAAIRANRAAITPREADADEDDIAEAPEGQLLTRVHRVRERNRALVERKKLQALATHGRLVCEACGFDYAYVYGERGEGFIECHHTVPVGFIDIDGRRPDWGAYHAEHLARKDAQQ